MLSIELLLELQRYVDLHRSAPVLSVCADRMLSKSFSCCPQESEEIDDFIKRKRKPAFNQILFSYIDKKGTCDAEIYKKAGMDRRHFSKIRSNPDYHPSKNTVIALALVLELDPEEADALLGAAGYSLSDSETFDLVITFCLERKIYSLHDVNLALDYFSLKPLAGVSK